ncbi:PREDICTED: transmembrane protein 69 [Tinamus guttatus]|nr:PREDICTED: transmembrane protein 69 [Tinamus guttatus]
MFRLVQRCCFQTPFRLQKLTGSRLLHFGKNKTSCSFPLIFHLHRDVSLLSRSPSFNQTSIYAAKLQAFHTSIPLLKKKKPKEPENKELDPQKYRLASIKDSPKPALYLSLAGLFPFVSVPLAMAVQGTYYPELAFAQITYGAMVVSFLGGIKWGFAIPENSPAKPDWRNLGNSVVPPLFAWQVFLYENLTCGALLLVMGLGIALHYDLGLLPTYPAWFKALRIVTTLVAVVSLLTTATLKMLASENLLKTSTVGWKNTK